MSWTTQKKRSGVSYGKSRGLKPKERMILQSTSRKILIQTFNTIGGVIAGRRFIYNWNVAFVGGIGIMNIMFVSVTGANERNWYT